MPHDLGSRIWRRKSGRKLSPDGVSGQSTRDTTDSTHEIKPMDRQVDPLAETLSKYSRAIFHMRRQLHRDRLGLVFGAGLSAPWNVPKWEELNERIATSVSLDGAELKDCSETLLTQRLFEHYRNKVYENAGIERQHKPDFEREIRKGWKDIVYDALYQEVEEGKTGETLESEHPFISKYVEIMKCTPLTINYNLDDFIERILAGHSDRNEARGYETTWDIRLPFRSNSRVVYHPNGYLPQNKMEASENIVLSEDEFAERLLGAMMGNNASLLHHLSRNTCLFIGLSLGDETLKQLLRQVALSTPGQYHYYVHYCADNDAIDLEEKKAIAATNFGSFNLITLFLDNKGIADLGDLIGTGCGRKDNKDEVIIGIAQKNDIQTHYFNYVTGSVGSGKTSIVMHLRNLTAYEEWADPPIPQLGEDPDNLGEKIETVDSWVAEQFFKKNNRLGQEGPGVFVIDRCPLDPIAFTPADQRIAKAKRLQAKITPSTNQKIVRGRVILLIEDPEVLWLRNIMTEKKHTVERLQNMQSDLMKIYDCPGVITVETRHLTLPEVIKRVSEIIFLEAYLPEADISGQLAKIVKGEVHV
jgi:hypothetical protein